MNAVTHLVPYLSTVEASNILEAPATKFLISGSTSGNNSPTSCPNLPNVCPVFNSSSVSQIHGGNQIWNIFSKLGYSDEAYHLKAVSQPEVAAESETGLSVAL